MKTALICNGPSQDQYVDLDYDYVMGCNIPQHPVDATVIIDRNVILYWAAMRETITAPCLFSVEAWRFADEIKFRKYILEHGKFLGLLPKPPEFYNAGHQAAETLIRNGATSIDIYGCDSYFEDTVESSTNKYVDDHNASSEKQRIKHWRINWERILLSHSDVTINFIRKSQ